MKYLLPALLALMAPSSAAAQDFSLDLREDAPSWNVVVDGVMGGRSTGKVRESEPGVLTFSGDLSLENNGGFSSVRRAIEAGSLSGVDELVLECRGDGRTYSFDIRTSDKRRMASSYRLKFDTVDGEWVEVRMPLSDFRFQSFGRNLSTSPIDPAKIESIGITLGDKKAGPFSLDLRRLSTPTPRALRVQRSSTGLASVAEGAGLTRLLEAVGAAGLVLPDGPVTILAPTNAAFEALPPAVAEQAMADPNGILRQVLTFHVLDGALSSSELLNRRTLVTLQGQELEVDAVTRRLGEAALVTTDVAFDGGVVHVIDSVLLPELRSITDLAVANEDLETLVAAVTAAGLAGDLGTGGPFTVFAPVDAAFEALPAGALDTLLEERNLEALQSVLGFHVVPGRVPARALLQPAGLKTLAGQELSVSLKDGQLAIGEARIIATDIQASNGVVHLLDAVLLPEGVDPKPVPDELRVYAEAMELYGLAVERGVPLFNEGDHGSCAAIYEVAAQAILRLGADRMDADLIERLERDCKKAAEETNARSRAWDYRRALDRIYRFADRQLR